MTSKSRANLKLNPATGTTFADSQQLPAEQFIHLADSMPTLIDDFTPLKTRVDVSIDTDGTLKAGAVDVAAVIADGIIAAQNLWPDPLFRHTTPGTDWGSRTRWYLSANVAYVADASNKYTNGGNCMQISSSGGGRAIWADEAGMKEGDVATVKAVCYAASGEWYMTARWFTAANSALGSNKNTSAQTFSGSELTFELTLDAVPATAAYCRIYWVRNSGSTLNVRAVWLNRGKVYNAPMPDMVNTYTMYEISDARNGAVNLSTRLGDMQPGNIVFDPFNEFVSPGYNWGGRKRWIGESVLSIVTNDSGNPRRGNTLRLSGASGSIFGGKLVWLDEIGAKAGDTINIHMWASGNAADTIGINARYFASSGTALASQVTGTKIAGTGAPQEFTLTTTVPTLSASLRNYLAIYPQRATGSNNMDVYSIQAVVNSTVLDTPGPSVDNSWLWYNARMMPYQDIIGAGYLRTWKAQLAHIAQATSNEQAVIAFIGDSWVLNSRIFDPLTEWLQTEYGDAGPGFVSIGNNHGSTAMYGVTSYSRTGTWTDSDQASGSRGPDIAHADTSDTATPAAVQIVATYTSAVIHHINQSGGGSYRWRIDGGSWTTVSTSAGSEAHDTATISGLSSASHTLDIELVSGTVRLLGVDLQKSGNGVRVHRLGNGGATVAQYVAVDSTIWQASIAALAPDVAIILLGTNDHSGNRLPGDFGADIATLAGRVRSARSLCDVMLLSPCDNGLSGKTYTVGHYSNELRSRAVANSYAFVDAHQAMGTYTNADALGLWENTSHINEVGAQQVADMLIRVLKAK